MPTHSTSQVGGIPLVTMNQNKLIEAEIEFHLKSQLMKLQLVV